MAFRGLATGFVAVLMLSGCAAGSSGQTAPSAVSSTVAVATFCGNITAQAASDPALPAVTQCEVMDFQGDTLLVVQFDDIVKNGVDNGLTDLRSYLFLPYKAAAEEFGRGGSALDFVDTLVVPTRDRCETVWDIPPDVARRIASGELTIEQGAELSSIDALTYC